MSSFCRFFILTVQNGINQIYKDAQKEENRLLHTRRLSKGEVISRIIKAAGNMTIEMRPINAM